MSAVLSDPEFISRFQSNNPNTLSFLNQAGRDTTHSVRIMDDGRAQRSLPQSAVSQSMEERSRMNAQLQQNAMSTTGTFMNKPHTGVEFNKNVHVEQAQSKALFGSLENVFSDVEGYLPKWLKSEPVVIGLMVVLGYYVFFKSK